MPSLTPTELQAARRASGHLGGRPRKLTATEAREQALDDLMPRALRVLRDMLDDGGPAAVRAAITVLAYSWGRPSEHLTVTPGLTDGADLRSMSDAELGELRRRLLGQLNVAALPAAEA